MIWFRCKRYKFMPYARDFVYSDWEFSWQPMSIFHRINLCFMLTSNVIFPSPS